MAKSSSRRTLKSLFSRSEVSLNASGETDKNEEEKTKFRFLKFKKKTKSDPVPAKASNEIQQLLSAAEPTDTAKDGEAWDDIIATDKKSSIYRTTSRSKGKEFSYSELDLRKPKGFTSFTFAFRKKKSDRVNISQSTIGLNHGNIEEQAETPPNHRQTELDQANAKTVSSMPQPELDTINTFDIPSPPPVATNQAESQFPLPNQLQTSDGVGPQPEAMERLANASSLCDVHVEPQKAQITTIPELQLDNPDSLDEKQGDDDDTSSSTTVVDNQTVPSLPASRPLPALDTSICTTAFVDNIATSVGPCDDDILRQSRSNTEISHTGSTTVTLSSRHQPGDLDMADDTSQHAELSASANSHIDDAVGQSAAVPHADVSALDSASVHQEVSISRTDKSAAVTARSAAKASAVGGEKGASPVRQDVVYEALYDSLFPQSFGSGVMSSSSNPPPQIITEIRHLDSKSAPVMVKTLNEHHTETSIQFDSAARKVGDAVGDYTNVNATFSERKVIYSSESSRLSSYQTSGASERLRDPDIYTRYSPSSLKSGTEPSDGDPILYSEPTPCLSEVKLDSFSLIQDNVRSVPTVESPASPVSDYVISQGGDTQVTHSKRRAILVKELVTEEASSNPICLSPVSENMSSATRLEVRIETMDTFFAPSGQAGGSDGLLSPSYLSVGSDDPTEIYYSAEEDNEEGSGNEEMYMVYERIESHVVDKGREARLQEEFPQQAEEADGGIRKKEEGECRVVIIKTQNEGVILANEEEKEDVNSQFEVEEKARGQRSDTPVQETETSEFLVGSDAESLEKEVATAVLPQVGDEGALPDTPVQQVDKPTVCDFAPPSSESHGEGEGSEGNLTDKLETEDPPNGEAALPGQEAQYLAHKDLMSSEYTAANSMGEGDTLTPRPSEAEEQVSAEVPRIGEASQDASETTGTGSGTAGCAVTATSAGGEVVTGTTPQAAEIEHNRAASSEWVDTITQSPERTATVQEQVSVSADTRLPDPEAAGTRSERRPSEAQPDPNQGSSTASRTQPTAASEGFASVDQKGSVTEMNSSYSSLSTKLSIKNSSPPKEDETKNRFRKVSLINEANATEVSRDTVDFSQDNTAVDSESNGTDSGSDYKWRNRFEGVSQYRPHKTGISSSSDSLSYRISDSYSGPSFSSSSSALPDSTAYKDLSNSSSSYQEEHVTNGNRLSEMTKVSLSFESEPVGAPKDEWRRSLLEWEEPAAPAGEREGEAEAERLESRWDSQQLPVSGISSAHGCDAIDRFEDDDLSRFTGVFKATLVDLISEPAAPPSTPPASPDEESPIQFDMDILVDTLKNMGPSFRPRNTSLRGAPPVLVSSLPPIVEDASSPVTPDIPANLISPAKKMEAIANPAESLKGVYTLPSDVGLKRNISRDTRSPLELMKQNQQEQPELGTRGLNLSLRSSLTNSLVLRRSSDSSPEELKSPTLNGNGLLPPSITGSRLENSVIFGSHRSASIDQTFENGKTHRPLFRTGSLPDKGPSNDRMSLAKMELSEPGSGTEAVGSRFERFSFLLNSPSGSLVGTERSTARMSLPPLRSIGSPPSSNSPTRLLSPTGTIDLQRPFTPTDSPFNMFGQTQVMGVGAGTGAVGNPILQRSFSSEGTVGVQQTPLFNSRLGGSQFQSQELESEKNLALKYRAFPDAYLTKEKEHGKLNPRPGKMYIFDRPGMCGQRIEVRSDVIDATPWELQETISIRVVRGGWVLYEKPNFKGEKIALDEGDIELTYPFNPEEQLHNGGQNGETSDVPTEPAPRFIIGSLRRAVRDYSVPEICLFPEENAEGKKVTFRDTSEDARIFGFPIKANSIIINAGLWLVYAHPFFQGLPRVLEVGGFPNPAAWGVEQPYVGSLHPLKVGEPRVENTSEPKMVIFDKPYFTGKSRTISTNMRDFMTRADRKQTVFMYNVGSLKVQGGMWVGYEKEGFRGHQYLLEEGEYHDWRVWGGCDAELRSVRVIRADLTDPIMVMFEQPDEEQEGMEENTFEVTEAIPDVELFEYRTVTRSIHVLSGAWIAYSHVDYSGNQYILEKGFYNNCADWGSQDNRICSVQPIRLAPSEGSSIRTEVILYSEPDFQGECHVFKHNQEELPEKLLTKSCRVSGASWVLYENTHHSGNLYVLSEGDFPNLSSMGCPPVCNIRSLKVVPMTLSVPSISLFGLECLEGREITMDTEIPSMVEEGFNNHILSVRVNSSCWVICEHSNYRGRQFLLEPIEITNWPKFSSIPTIGSLFPVRQKRRFLRIKNKERGHFLSVQGGVEEMKSGRVVVTPEVEPMSDIWFYQDGFIKSKLSPTMSLQVMGTIEPAAKVVLWAETRQPVQMWSAQMRGLITSLTFPGFVLDIKGGKTYDKDHVVIMPEDEEKPSQQWYIELL